MSATLHDAELARDLTWTYAMARHSGGLASMYIVFDEDDGELHYGLVRALDVDEVE